MVRAGTSVTSSPHCGGLGNAVGLAQDVGLELVEAQGLALDVFLVVGALGDPHVGDGSGQRRGGAGPVGDPLVAHVGRGVVEVGIQEDLADALVPEPQTPLGRLVAAVDAVRGVDVVAPVDDELGVLEAVLEHVVVLGVAQPPVEAEGVGGAPVPAFPAVRVVEDVGEADEAEEPGPGAGTVADVAPVVVRGRPGGDGLRAVLSRGCGSSRWRPGRRPLSS